MKQLHLLKDKKYAFRKVVRPINTRGWNHVIFKSRMPLLRLNHKKVERTLREAQLRFHIRLRSLAIMETHVHLLISCQTRDGFANFLRYFAGILAIRIGRGKIWESRAWSRIVRAGRDLLNVIEYIWNNPIKAGLFDEVEELQIWNGIVVRRRGVF